MLGFSFDCGNRRFSLGASVGVAPFHASEPPAAVLSRADMARHAAKRAGGNRHHLFTRVDVSVKRHQWELDWSTDFEDAVQRGDLTLFAQRIEPLGADDPVPHYEVLLRNYENGRPTSPAQFLPSANRYGLMPTMGRWVMERSFEFLAGIGRTPLQLSINLAAETVDRPDFPHMVEALAERSSAASSR